MKRISKWIGPMVFGAVIAGGALAPTTSEAVSITINNVTVTSLQGADTDTWCIAGCAAVLGSGPIWSSFAGTVVNSPDTAGNKNFILTQNTPANDPGAFNFDTSEHTNGAGSFTTCTAAAPCTMTLTLNTSIGIINVPLPAANALNDFNADPGGPAHNESQNWTSVLVGGAGGLNVAIGYADTAHSDACDDNNAGIGGQTNGNCRPDAPWSGSANTVFAGNPGQAPFPFCARPIAGSGATGTCFDAGTILITANNGTTTQTPEPGSMFLLGAGLFGLAAWSRKRKN